MRLKTTFLLMVVLLTAILSATVFAGFALHKQDITQQEREELSVTADSIASHLESRVEGKSRTLALWAEHPDVADHGSDAQRAALAAFVAGTEFEGASVVSANGTMVGIVAANTSESSLRDLVGRNFSHRTYVRHALAGETYVSEPLSAESGNAIVTVSVPVVRDGEVVGALNGAVHLSEAALFSSVERMVEPAQSVRVAAGDRTLYRLRSPDSETMVGRTTLSSSNWTVTVLEEREEIQAKLHRATLAQAGAVLLAIVSTAILGLWVHGTTLRQVDRLVDGFDDLTAGDYDSEVDLGGTDEWARIGERFESLRHTLSQRESQLHVLNRVLRHNLRNDMNVVLLYAEQILDRDPAPEIADDAETIRNTANRLVHMSEHSQALYEELLRDYRQQRTPVDLVDVVERQAVSLGESFPAVDIETDLPERATVLDTDVLPLVVEELGLNAIVHNDCERPECVLTFGVERDESAGEVRLRVSDNGPGMPEVERALLTGSREETAIEHGSGLGVWLVNWLVDMLDGRVTVDVGEERGTTVTVHLPATDEAPMDAA